MKVNLISACQSRPGDGGFLSPSANSETHLKKPDRIVFTLLFSVLSIHYTRRKVVLFVKVNGQLSFLLKTYHSKVNTGCTV